MALLQLSAIAITAAVLPAQIVGPAADISSSVKAGMIAAACKGKVASGVCDRDLLSGGESSWSLGVVHLGHFISTDSEDALATVQLDPGFSPRRYSTMGLLLSRKEGSWQVMSEPVIAADFSHCRRLRSQNATEFLVCVVKDFAEFVHSRQLQMISVRGDEIKFKTLLEASDNTRACNEDRLVEKATIDRVAIDNRNNVTVVARHGKMQRSITQQQKCAWGEQNVVPVMQRYTVELRFEGEEYRPAPASLKAAKLFGEKER